MTRALELEPSNAMYHAICGYLLATVGEAQLGLERCRFALRLSPRDSREPFLCYMLGNALVANGDYEEAIEVMTRSRRYSEVDYIWIIIAFAHFRLGANHRAIACLQSIQKPRSMKLYAWSVTDRMWLGVPAETKVEFLKLFRHAGIGH